LTSSESSPNGYGSFAEKGDAGARGSARWSAMSLSSYFSPRKRGCERRYRIQYGDTSLGVANASGRRSALRPSPLPATMRPSPSVVVPAASSRRATT